MTYADVKRAFPELDQLFVTIDAGGIELDNTTVREIIASYLNGLQPGPFAPDNSKAPSVNSTNLNNANFRLQKLNQDLDGDGIVSAGDILEMLSLYAQTNFDYQSSAEQVDALVNSIVDQYSSQ